MNINVVRNKYINAFLVFLFFCSIIHFIIITYLAIVGQNIYYLNIFHILAFDMIFATIFSNTMLSNAISFVVVAMSYLLILYFNKTE